MKQYFIKVLMRNRENDSESHHYLGGSSEGMANCVAYSKGEIIHTDGHNIKVWGDAPWVIMDKPDCGSWVFAAHMSEVDCRSTLRSIARYFLSYVEKCELEVNLSEHKSLTIFYEGYSLDFTIQRYFNQKELEQDFADQENEIMSRLQEALVPEWDKILAEFAEGDTNVIEFLEDKFDVLVSVSPVDN